MRFIIAALLLVAFGGVVRSAPIDPEDLCAGRFTVTSGANTLDTPVCSAYGDLETLDQTGITRVVVVLHGSSQTAQDNVDNIIDGAEASSQTGNTVIIGPQYLLEQDVDAYSLDDEIYWTGTGSTQWRDGYDSGDTGTNPRSFQVSSFEVMDQILARIADPAYFPDLEEVHILGHSAGSGFLGRYAAAGAGYESFDPSVVVTTYPANGTGLYWTRERPDLPALDTFSEKFSTGCDSTYNDYRYGTDNMPPYQAAVGAEQMAVNFVNRRVMVLIGLLDNDPDHVDLIKTCDAELGGPHRLARATAQYNHLIDHFGDISAYSKIEFIPGVAHSHGQMWTSEEAVALVFGYDPTETGVTFPVAATTYPACRR